VKRERSKKEMENKKGKKKQKMNKSKKTDRKRKRKTGSKEPTNECISGNCTLDSLLISNRERGQRRSATARKDALDAWILWLWPSQRREGGREISQRREDEVREEERIEKEEKQEGR